MRMPDWFPEMYWFVLSAIFFTIGIVGALGEWVFHWWNDPWQWASPVSVLLGVVTLGLGASAKRLQEFREETAQRDERLLAGLSNQSAILDEHTRLLKEISEQTKPLKEISESLREVVASFRGR